LLIQRSFANPGGGRLIGGYFIYFFQHPNISLICWDAVLLREIPKREGVRKPLLSSSPATANTGFGERARARARGRARARACAPTWEIHIPELRPGPARDQLGAGNGAGGGSKSANMSKKRVRRARFVEIPTFPNFPVFFHFGGPKGSSPKKSQKSSRNVYIYIYVSCDVEFYRVLKLSKINLERPGALRFTLSGSCLSRPVPAGEGPAQKVPRMSHETFAWPTEIDFGKF